MLRFLIGIICILLHRPKKITLELSWHSYLHSSAVEIPFIMLMTLLFSNSQVNSSTKHSPFGSTASVTDKKSIKATAATFRMTSRSIARYDIPKTNVKAVLKVGNSQKILAMFSMPNKYDFSLS